LFPRSWVTATRGAGADIGPGATLIFEVELLSIPEQGQTRRRAKISPRKKQVCPLSRDEPALQEIGRLQTLRMKPFKNTGLYPGIVAKS